MKNALLATLVAGALSIPAVAMAADEPAAAPSPFTGNISLVSDYVFRGISQTSGKPALQGGFDYAHPSGLYLGTWASNISWITDTAGATGSSLEVDFYGGYKGSITSDLAFDLGLVAYTYPNRELSPGFLKQETREIYGALSYKWLTLKYSRSLGALFGWNETGTMEKTKGSGYLEANATFDLGSGWGLTGHAGHQKVSGRSSASYSDYKIGITKDIGFGVAGLAVSSTNAKGNCGAVEDYCWAVTRYDAGQSAAILSFAKTF